MSDIADRLPSTASAPGRAIAVGLPALTTEFVSGAAWDAVVADFDEVCQEQLYAFAISRWPDTEQEPVVFRRDGAVAGGVLIMIQRLPLGLGAIAVCKWGPLLRRSDQTDAAAVYAAMIEALVAEYAVKRGMMLSVLPHASLEPQNARCEHLIARGFRRGSQLLFPNRYIVNLQLDDAAQRKSFHQKWRYHLNKSEKQGLVLEHADVSRMGEFHALYGAMTDRKQFSDHSAYDGIDELMAIENPALRPELFFVRHEGETVGGAIIFKAGARAVYLYGATSDKALPLRAGYFLHWHIIRWLRDNTEAKWYDLGGTDGYQGLHQFKKGMVGDAGVIEPVPPVVNYAARPLAYALGAGAYAARDAYQHAHRVIDAWRNPKARPDQERPARRED